ncbi:MAG: hypothetical protein F4018_03475 [Acidobacteria bacterium]|nr:hypothetical protein [Acidobacteriota bacterium]MYK87469.1 hypothetical protein [Acidobacteriota bacterium]
MTLANFQFFRDVQIKPKWGWPATFSCNGQHEVWPGTRYGLTPEGEREHLEGVLALLDEIVDDVLHVEPRGGRFHVDDRGVFLAAGRRQVTEFVLRM